MANEKHYRESGHKQDRTPISLCSHRPLSNRNRTQNVYTPAGGPAQIFNFTIKLELTLESEGEDGHEIWSQTVNVSTNQPQINYRFFIAHIHESEHEDSPREVMVLWWETNRLPRTVTINIQNDPELATFGVYNGIKSIDKGWLTSQSAIHIRLHSNPIHMWKTVAGRQPSYFIKCSPLDFHQRDTPYTNGHGPGTSLDDSTTADDFHSVDCANKLSVSVLNGEQDRPEGQGQFGTLYKEHDYMVFRIQTFKPESLGFQFDFYQHDPNGGPDQIPKYAGYVYMLPENLRHTNGQLTLPITGCKHKPIGKLSIEHVLIKPMRDLSCNMEMSFSRYWKHSRRPLDVGHRGMGSTFHQTPALDMESECPKENTLQSLNEAGSHGADFVEFDVQLTKDKIPVIFHDFIVSLSMRKKHSTDLDWFEIPVGDLSLEQLQSLKIDHRSEQKKGSPSPSPLTVENEMECTFPTLKNCFEKLDPHIGFNIEIKYCMHLNTGEREDGLKYYDERNQYIDIILSEVLRSAGRRRIIFSTFDPDVCVLIRLKQNRYPVMFLTQGVTAKYEDFDDPRTRDTMVGYHFALCEKLLGVVPHSEELLKQPELISQGKKLGLILFCWGTENNSKETIRYLKEKGVDGVIYDRIHQLKDSKENVFKLENEAKKEMLQSVGMMCNGTVAVAAGTSNGTAIANGSEGTSTAS